MCGNAREGRPRRAPLEAGLNVIALSSRSSPANPSATTPRSRPASAMSTTSTCRSGRSRTMSKIQPQRTPNSASASARPWFRPSRMTSQGSPEYFTFEMIVNVTSAYRMFWRAAFAPNS